MTQTTPEDRFVRAMKEAREAAGMTQNQLARTLRDEYGLSFQQQMIQRIETGQRPVRLNEAFAVADALGSTVTEMTEDPSAALGQALDAARTASEALAKVGPAMSELKRALAFLEARLGSGEEMDLALHLKTIYAAGSSDRFEPREVDAVMQEVNTVLAKLQSGSRSPAPAQVQAASQDG